MLQDVRLVSNGNVFPGAAMLALHLELLSSLWHLMENDIDDAGAALLGGRLVAVVML
jgi:glycopeptide antibiotics resistance protein